MKKKNKFSSKDHCYSNVWNKEDSNAFSIKLFEFKKYVCVCVHFGKTFKNEL